MISIRPGMLAWMLCLIGVFFVGVGTVSGRQTATNCDQKCYMRDTHFFTGPNSKCVYWAYTSCLLCGSGGTNSLCADNQDGGGKCRDTGSRNISYTLDSCDPLCDCVGVAIVEASTTGNRSNPIGSTRWICLMN